MGVAVMLAIDGTVSSFLGFVLTTGRSAGDPGIPINGWLLIVGATCYALSSLRALRVARARWVVREDALWPVAWALCMAAVVLGLSSAVGPELLGPIIPGEHQWASFGLVVLAAGCSFAASTLVLQRVVAWMIGAAMSVAAR
jgi:hypothetical protein